MTGFAHLVGDRVRKWFDAQAEHVTVEFFEERDAQPLVPGAGYVRLWLAEGFLAKSVTWTNKHFPALYGGVTLSFAEQRTPFTRFTKPSGTFTAPGAYLDYQMTPLLPYNGGTLEVEAALYQASIQGPLAAAVSIAGSIASLVGPPLSMAATIADKVSDGMASVLNGQDQNPVLGLHRTLVAEGGGGLTLRSGHLVVVNAPRERIPGTLRMDGERLSAGGGQLTGFDYLILRIECRAERDELYFPQLQAMLSEATAAYLKGNEESFTEIRTRAIAEAVGSPDLTRQDSLRVARYVATQFEEIKRLGIVPTEEGGFDPIPANQLPGADEVADLTLADLLRA